MRGKKQVTPLFEPQQVRTPRRVFARTSILGKFSLLGSALTLNPLSYSSLPSTSQNETLTYCNDCQVTNPCAGSGTGALAKRLHGQWVCNQDSIDSGALSSTEL
jgi:hypothetical protein